MSSDDVNAVPEHIRQEAANLSKTQAVARVFKLDSGRYVATTASRHMIPGKVVEVFVRGEPSNIG